jgi:hypothetical protein
MVEEYGKKAYNNVVFKTGSTYCSPWLLQNIEWSGTCQLGLSGTGVGLWVSWGDDFLVANNTVYNTESGILMGYQEDHARVYNNTCVGCSGPAINDQRNYSYDWHGQNDDLQRNFAASSSVLVDPANRNFQLAPGTNSLVNAGMNLSAYFNTDANGVTRGQEGGQWDVGACERFSGASSCPNFQGTAPPTM